MHIVDLFQTREAFIAARLEERGFALTRHVQARHARSRFNFQNLSGEIANGFEPRGTSEAYMLSYSEAAEWMKVNLLCVPDLGQVYGAWWLLTEAGRNLTRDTVDLINLKKILPEYLLHPRVRDVALEIFLIGKYDAAVFAAFKEIEIAVRNAAGFNADAHGQPMIGRAFNSDKGPLRSKSEVESERQALQSFMSGSYGLFRNPHSHRNADLTDPKEATEMLIIASHMMRLIESSKIHPPDRVKAPEK